MIRSITIKGLGLDESVDLSPGGATTISRPSMQGKTRLGRALVLLWTGKEPWGSSPDARNGEPIFIEARTGSMVLSRKITRSPKGSLSHARKLEYKGDAVDVGSEKKWSAAVSRLCRVGKGAGGDHGDAAVSRLVMWPLVWRELLTQDGRPLRDLLISCLDTEEAIAKIVREAPCYRDEDPTTEKGAIEARRLAKQNAATADGRHKEATSALERLQPVAAPLGSDVDRARALLASETAWEGFRAYMDRYDAWTDWHLRRERLGEEPKRPEKAAVQLARDNHMSAQTASRRAAAEVDAGEALVREAKRLLGLAERDIENHGTEAPAITDACSQCGQAWEQAKDASQAAHDAWVDRALLLRTALERAQETLNGAEGGLIKARERDAAADEAETVFARERQEVEDLLAASYRYREAAQAMGKEPKEPKPIIDQPPGVPPTAEAIWDARAIIEAETKAKGASDLRDSDRKRQEKAVEAARVKANAAADEADRLEDLVTAIREAPAQLLPFAIEHLGDCGPVHVIPDGAGLRVTVNGHPWQEASTGELIHADLMLRVAIRRAFSVRWLPIVVDRVQDWSGEWGEVPGPVVFLQTVPPPSEE